MAGASLSHHSEHRRDKWRIVGHGVRCTVRLPPRIVHQDAGQIVIVLRSKEHTFRTVSGFPAQYLVILTPGGFEGFFAEMAAGQFRIPEDLPEIADIAACYHLTFTGPPMGPANTETIQ